MAKLDILLKRLGCRLKDDNIISCKGKKEDIKLKFVEKEEIAPAFGVSYYSDNKILVRKDLPEDIRNHVILHEVVHQLGYRDELSANLMAFFKDPTGWLKTAKVTLEDPERRKFYLSKI